MEIFRFSKMLSLEEVKPDHHQIIVSHVASFLTSKF
jgi:hypothetical protein